MKLDKTTMKGTTDCISKGTDDCISRGTTDCITKTGGSKYNDRSNGASTGMGDG